MRVLRFPCLSVEKAEPTFCLCSLFRQILTVRLWLER